MVGKLLRPAVSYEPDPHIDYNHPFGIGVSQITDGEEEMGIMCTFLNKERIVNAYGGWYEILKEFDCDALAFRFTKEGLCEVLDDFRIEGCAQNDFEMDGILR